MSRVDGFRLFLTVLLAIVAAGVVPACAEFKIVPNDGGQNTGGSTGNIMVGTGGAGMGGRGGGDAGIDAPDAAAGGSGGGGIGGMLGMGGVVGAGGMVAPPPPAMLAIDPGSKDLSVVVLGRYADASFQITNVGGVATTVPTVAIDGTDAAQFAIMASDCSVAIAPGKSCLVTIRFAPTTAGLKTARLNVQAMLGGAVTATLQGNGVRPGALTITPTNQSFGSVVVGQQSIAVTFTVANTGGETSGALATAVSDSTELTITADTCKGTMLPPAATCTIVMSFAPIGAGPKSATLSVTGAPGGTASAALTGVGLGSAAMVVNPAMISFPSTVAGATSAPVTVNVSNPGGVAVGGTTGLTSIITGTNAAEFAITSNTCGATLAPGASCAIAVSFKPTSAGSKSAVLGLTAAPGGTVAIPLAGTARTPATLALDTASGSSLDFGMVTTSASASQTFVVTNGGQDGTSALTLAATGTDFTISAPGAGDCVSGTSVLAAGASCTVHVKFAPVTTGAKTTTLSVTAATGGSASRTLTGTAVAPGALAIAPPTGSFGSLQVGTSGTPVVFTVTNSGGTTTGALATAITGSTELSITADTCKTRTLAAAATCTISVTFAPSSAGAKTGTLTATATPGGTASASLTGVGLALAQLSVAPASFTFAAGTVAGTTGATQSFTVTNVGGVASGTLAATLTGTDAPQFAITSSTCTAALAAGATCTVGVAFKPTSSGAKSASLSVAANPGGTATAALGATALSPALLRLDPAGGSTTTFPSVLIGGNNLQTFVVTNGGQQASSALTIAVTGADFTAVAAATGDCVTGTTTLAPSATCTVRVRFAPSAAGSRTGTVAASATTGGSPSLALTGTGVAPSALTVLPLSQAYTPVLVGSPSGAHQFTFTNTGGAATAALTTTLTPATAFAITADTCKSAALAPSATCTITVGMTPPAAGPLTATLTVSGGAGISAVATLTGVGLAPAALTISPTTFAFPGTEVATISAALTFNITNTGDVAAGTTTALSAKIAGTNPADFAIASSTCSGTLDGAGAKCQVIVSFNPAVVGNRAATLTVSGTPGGTVSSTLTGAGLRSPSISATPATLDFGKIQIGVATAVRNWTISNNGDISTGTLTLTSSNPTDFVISNGCTVALAGQASCTITVAAKPSAAGVRAGMLTLTGARGGSVGLAITATGSLSDGQACTTGAQCLSGICNSFFVDGDGDHYGTSAQMAFCTITAAPAGFAVASGDCCDTNAAINPGADFQMTIGSCAGVPTWDYNCSGRLEKNRQACQTTSCTLQACTIGCSDFPDTSCGQMGITITACAPADPVFGGCQNSGDGGFVFCR